MPALAKIQSALTFIKAIQHDGKDDHPARPLIRHQNPRLNGPGVAPAPPLPPRRLLQKRINKNSKQKEPIGEARQLAIHAGFRYIPAVNRLDDGKLHENAPAAGPPGSEEKTVNCNKPIPEAVGKADQATVLVCKPPADLRAAKLLNPHKSADTLRSMASGCSNKSRKSRIPPLPRIPHQRMHFITRLGSGGEGHCDLFRLHNPPRTLLAIKTLNEIPDLIWHKNIKRKPLEAHILQDLLPPHPRILRLYDYTYSPLSTKLYYEYCSLGDLQDLIDNHFKRDIKVPEGFIWHAFAQLAEAVHHLHTGAWDEQGKHVSILHRDIKPTNILLRPSSSSSSSGGNNNIYPDLVLADFGVATHGHASLDKNYAVGTMMFQGPEIPYQDAASDVWGLGCVVHALALGGPAMCRRPEGVSEGRWEWDPRSRVVLDVTESGYSGFLREVL
ncbi:MAG: hypothetical protein Q9188_002419, partial [Gyalolechia gomerana]